MKILNLGGKKQANKSDTEKTLPKRKNVFVLKSNGGENQDTNAIRDLLIGRYDRNLTGDISLTTTDTIRYYKVCAPVFTAIDIISKEIGNITPEIWNKKENKWDTFKILDLLEHPDGLCGWYEFITSLFAFKTITGNSYILAEGDVKNPPKRLTVINPSDVMLSPPGLSGDIKLSALPYPSRIDVTTEWGHFSFLPSIKDNQVRYYDEFRTFELWHMRTFNPQNNSYMYGMSPLNSVYYEIQQYINLSKHNLSLLARGASSEYLIIIKNELDSDEEARFKEQLDSENTGSNNAGRPLILHGDEATVHQITKSNKDMEFETAQKRVAMAIYSALHIPLPMVSGDHMSLANYEASRLVLYDQAILPQAKYLFSQLTSFLMPRYGEENLIISYNQRNIPALESRKVEQVKLMRESQVFSDNEIRGFFGAEKASSGANKIYKPSNMLPIANDTEDNEDGFQLPALDQPNVEFNPEEKPNSEPKNNTSIERFKAILQERKDDKGNNLFTDEEIAEMATKFGVV